MGIVRARDDSCNNAPVRRGSRTGHRYEPARDRGTRGDGAGQRRRTRGRPRPGGGCMPEGWMPLVGAGPHPPAGRRLTVAVYETATARGATVIIPPAKTANISGHGPRSPARDRTITVVKQLGRRRWKQASGYHRQGRVENAFFRYKSIIGDGLRARSPAGQRSEVVLGCAILNRVTEFGRPVSYRIGR